MRNITEEARIVMNTRRNFVNYAHVTLHNGDELFLKPSDFRISGNNFTDDWNDGEAFQLGSAIGKTATLLLDNTDGRTEEIEGETVVYPHGKFSEYDFYMAYFELYIHLPDATHYQGELIDEIISIGTFTVTTPASHGATIEITGVDNMHMFDKPFNDCTLNFSGGQTLYTILRRCCTDCGVAIGFSSFLNQGIQVYKKPKDVTYREVVSYIAQLAGCNAVISVTGALTLKYYDMSVFEHILDGGRFNPWDGVDNVRDTLDGGSFNPWTGSPDDAISGGNFTDPLEYHNLTATNGTSVSTDDIHFTGIMVSYEIVNSEGSTEKLALHYPNVSNWDTYAMHIDDNPFVETQAIANTIATSVWDIIKSLSFRVFSCSSIQDPTIEAGDCALVYDVKGNVYPTIVTNVKFTTGGMTDVSCTAESPVKQNSRYVNPAAKAEAKAIQKQDDYNAMVAHFNEIAYASTSYSTVIKPSEPNVTYLCDHPTIEASTNVVKVTGSGTFISTDGGQSYIAGVDISTATMLMNLIYVKGIQADWIDVDKLSAISANMGDVIVGGTNSGKGTLKVYKNDTISDANKVVTLDKDGINAIAGYIGGSNGFTIKTDYMTTPSTGPTDVTSGSAGTYIGKNGFRNNSGSNYVTVTSGTLTANNVDIDGGDINMSSGKFHVESNGHMTCSNVTITGTNGTSTADAIDLGNGAFKVTNDGALTATSATITGDIQTGSTITGATITGGSITSDATNGSTTITGGRVEIIPGNDNYLSVIWDDRGDEKGVTFGRRISVIDQDDGVQGVFDYSTLFYSLDAHDSDRRVKKNIENISPEDSRNLILGIQPRYYEYNKDGKGYKGKRSGFIAQEVREVLDEIGNDSVIERENYRRDDGMRMIEYQDFIAHLVNTTQDLYKQNEELKARIEKLESIVNTK